MNITVERDPSAEARFDYATLKNRVAAADRVHRTG
jgi:hypothetical protein